MGTHHGMGLALHFGRYMLSFRELSSSTGDLDFIPFMLRSSLVLVKLKEGLWGCINKLREWQPTSGSPPELGTQWQCNCDLWKRPKQSDLEGQVNTVPRRWQ